MVKKGDSEVKKKIGDIAPKLVELTDDVLYADIWQREQLSPRERSLVTVAALIGGSNAEVLPFHLNKAKENGVSEEELIEVITHLAFYVGWPKALAAVVIAKETFASEK
jgi:4-carboxymuconolactone decarboxylase